MSGPPQNVPPLLLPTRPKDLGFPPHSPSPPGPPVPLVLKVPLYRQGGEWEEFFFSFSSQIFFFPFQPRREAKWRLELAWRGVPKSLSRPPPVLSRSVHLSVVSMLGAGAASHSVSSPLCCQSHPGALPPSPPPPTITSQAPHSLHYTPQNGTGHYGYSCPYFIDEETQELYCKC